MSYCPKCGNKVDETMTFCPICGASLKDAATSQTPLTQPIQNDETEKKEKEKQKNHHSEKVEKDEQGFIGYLMGGSILITIGIFALLDLTGSPLSSSQDLAAMLLAIGAIIIIGALYKTLKARKHVAPTGQISIPENHWL